MEWMAAIFLLALVASAAARCETPTNFEEAMREIADSNNAFSVELYKLLRSTSDNIIVSPMSAFLVLSMAWQGAAGATAEQLQAALHLPANRDVVNQGIKAFIESFPMQTESDVILRLANSVFLGEGAGIKDTFRDTAINVYHSQTQELDFENEPEESRNVINRWVEQITNNTIQELISVLSRDTKMVLVNAIYFKGAWKYPFYAAETKTEIFHTSSTTQVNVSMMQQIDNFGTLEVPELSARVLQLLYKGDNVKMYIVLPDAVDGLPFIENNLNLLNFTSIEQNLKYEMTQVKMPKMKIENTFELVEPLQQLGIEDAFTDRANFSGITDINVLVSRVVHKAFLDVNEAGTVAAAATGVIIRTTSGRIPSVTFLIDHQYLVVLVGSNENILFIGRVLQPGN